MGSVVSFSKHLYLYQFSLLTDTRFLFYARYIEHVSGGKYFFRKRHGTRKIISHYFSINLKPIFQPIHGRKRRFIHPRSVGSVVSFSKHLYLYQFSLLTDTRFLFYARYIEHVSGGKYFFRKRHGTRKIISHYFSINLKPIFQPIHKLKARQVIPNSSHVSSKT